MQAKTRFSIVLASTAILGHDSSPPSLRLGVHPSPGVDETTFVWGGIQIRGNKPLFSANTHRGADDWVAIPPTQAHARLKPEPDAILGPEELSVIPKIRYRHLVVDRDVAERLHCRFSLIHEHRKIALTAFQRLNDTHDLNCAPASESGIKFASQLHLDLVLHRKGGDQPDVVRKQRRHVWNEIIARNQVIAGSRYRDSGVSNEVGRTLWGRSFGQAGFGTARPFLGVLADRS